MRGGVSNETIGAALAADWRYVLGPDGEDVDEWEHRVRALGLLVLPFDQAELRFGGGLEWAQVTSIGYRRPSDMPPSRTITTGHGYVFEGATGYFWDRAPVRIGVELAVGHSTYSGASVDLRLAVRFRR